MRRRRMTEVVGGLRCKKKKNEVVLCVVFGLGSYSRGTDRCVMGPLGSACCAFLAAEVRERERRENLVLSAAGPARPRAAQPAHERENKKR
jgi:hypothetical protein